MLTVYSDPVTCDCEGFTRRDFLRAGTLGLGGLSLSWLLRQQAARAAEANYLRQKSVVLLFLSGGASHIETFSPNGDAPAPFRSVTGDVQTTVPGLRFGGTFPLLARHAHRMAVVRSFQHPVGGHVEAIVHVLTGGTDPTGRGSAGFGMGAAYARLRGSNHPDTGIPTYALMNSDEVDPQYRNEHGRVERGSRPNALGAAYAPFNPGGDGEAASNMTLNVSPDRLDSRRHLLTAVDRLRKRHERNVDFGGDDRFKQQAYELLLGGAAQALDVTREPLSVVERYDTSEYQVGKKVFRSSELGLHMLRARRLIEAGCGFVTIHSAGWDMHADSNNPGILRGMEMLGPTVDKATAAFLSDIEERGLLDDVLLIITGDFGRTPTINKRGGRDHWPKLCTLALAGGGLDTGGTIGSSSRKNDEPTSTPVTPAHLFGTVLHTLFDVSALRLARGVPRELMQVISAAQPISLHG